jgi:hypothetical protein
MLSELKYKKNIRLETTQPEKQAKGNHRHEKHRKQAMANLSSAFGSRCKESYFSSGPRASLGLWLSQREKHSQEKGIRVR